jgi:hypothetical protein
MIGLSPPLIHAQDAPHQKAATHFASFFQNEGKARVSTARFGGKSLDQPQVGIANPALSRVKKKSRFWRRQWHLTCALPSGSWSMHACARGKQMRFITDQCSLFADALLAPAGVVSRQEAAGSLLPLGSHLRASAGANEHCSSRSCLIRRQQQSATRTTFFKKKKVFYYYKNMQGMAGSSVTYRHILCVTQL